MPCHPLRGGYSLVPQCLCTFVFLSLEGFGSCKMAQLRSGRKGVIMDYQDGQHPWPFKVTLSTGVFWDLRQHLKPVDVSWLFLHSRLMPTPDQQLLRAVVIERMSAASSQFKRYPSSSSTWTNSCRCPQLSLGQNRLPRWGQM